MKSAIRATTVTAVLAAMTALAAPATANPILDGLKKQAGVEQFSAERGKAFYLARHKGGKPDTPSCTSCHTKNPKQAGKTRAGKTIAPMAISKTPDRYSDPKKVAKWFRRNCRSVLGRECTVQEKGDFLAFMLSQ